MIGLILKGGMMLSEAVCCVLYIQRSITDTAVARGDTLLEQLYSHIIHYSDSYGPINPSRPGTHLCLISRFLWAIQKQQIYKLIARHRVPRYELVYLLFLKNIENVVQIF